MGNRLRLNVAAYVLDMSDQQLTAGSGVANANQLINAESTKGSGIEFDAELLATEKLSLSLGVSFNSTEIDDPNLSVLPCGAPCTVLDPAGSFPGSVSLDDNDLPRAPEWTANFVARYTQPLPNGDLVFQTVQRRAGGLAFLRRHRAEALQKLGNRTLLAKGGDPYLVQRALVAGAGNGGPDIRFQ